MTDRRGFLRSALALLAAPLSALANGYAGPWKVPADLSTEPSAIEGLDEALAEMWDSQSLQPGRIWLSREAVEHIRRLSPGIGPTEPLRFDFDDWRLAYWKTDREAVKAWAAAPGSPLARLVEAERRLA